MAGVDYELLRPSGRAYNIALVVGTGTNNAFWSFDTPVHYMELRFSRERLRK